MNALDSHYLNTLAAALLEADDARNQAEAHFQRCYADLIRALTVGEINDTEMDATSEPILMTDEGHPALEVTTAESKPRKGWYNHSKYIKNKQTYD